jgi:hypothetical protein
VLAPVPGSEKSEASGDAVMQISKSDELLEACGLTCLTRQPCANRWSNTGRLAIQRRANPLLSSAKTCPGLQPSSAYLRSLICSDGSFEEPFRLRCSAFVQRSAAGGFVKLNPGGAAARLFLLCIKPQSGRHRNVRTSKESLERLCQSSFPSECFKATIERVTQFN